MDPSQSNTSQSSLSLSACSLRSLSPLPAFPTTGLGTNKYAVGSAVQNSRGNISGIVSSNLFVPSAAPLLKTGYGISLALISACTLLCTGFMIGLERENKKHDAGCRTIGPIYLKSWRILGLIIRTSGLQNSWGSYSAGLAGTTMLILRSSTNSSTWTIIEANVAIICACMPTYKAPLSKIFPGIFNSFYSSKNVAKPKRDSGVDRSVQRRSSPN
ncbi:hypothetical protein GX48_07293 [Paracoccidioides brasiliensis]|nr:hypothetical protein GX48_07293 [Paracoccidioides brasiliensis]